MNRVICGIAALLAVASTTDAPSAVAGGILVEVEAGPLLRKNTPIVFALPGSIGMARAVTLTQLDDGRAVDAQVLQGTPASVVWILRDPLPAGATRRYRIEPAADPAGTQKTAVACVDGGKYLRLRVGDQPVLQYNNAVVEPPRGINEGYRRSGFIHPLFTPSGKVVSDDFPPDHAHQHGVFFAWVNTTFEGRHLDFWNQMGKTGQVEHVETLETTGGPVFGQFQVKLRHNDLTAPGGTKPVLDEVWTVRAYHVGDIFLVDLESRQTCAGPTPLTINKYHYGGMGLRGNRDWLVPTGKGAAPSDPAGSGYSDFLTSEGNNRKTGNHTRPHWVGLSGRVGDRPAGVVMLDHPGNFRFPQPVRLHPDKPYFCFAPMVLGDFEIAPGRPYVSRYRFAVHDGATDAATIDRLWHDYAGPPRVRVVTGP
jgi:hypothetical protein